MGYDYGGGGGGDFESDRSYGGGDSGFDSGGGGGDYHYIGGQRDERSYTFGGDFGGADTGGTGPDTSGGGDLGGADTGGGLTDAGAGFGGGGAGDAGAGGGGAGGGDQIGGVGGTDVSGVGGVSYPGGAGGFGDFARNYGGGANIYAADARMRGFDFGGAGADLGLGASLSGVASGAGLGTAFGPGATGASSAGGAGPIGAPSPGAGDALSVLGGDILSQHQDSPLAASDVSQPENIAGTASGGDVQFGPPNVSDPSYLSDFASKFTERMQSDAELQQQQDTSGDFSARFQGMSPELDQAFKGAEQFDIGDQVGQMLNAQVPDQATFGGGEPPGALAMPNLQEDLGTYSPGPNYDAPTSDPNQPVLKMNFDPEAAATGQQGASDITNVAVYTLDEAPAELGGGDIVPSTTTVQPTLDTRLDTGNVPPATTLTGADATATGVQSQAVPGYDFGTSGWFDPQSAGLANARQAAFGTTSDTNMSRLANSLMGEVGQRTGFGSASANAIQAEVEADLNRSLSRDMPLGSTLTSTYNPATGTGYFPRETTSLLGRPVSDLDAAKAQAAFDAAMQGSDVSKLATGNASGTVGVGEPTFAARGATGMERFGVERPDQAWAAAMRDVAPANQQTMAGDVASRGGDLTDFAGLGMKPPAAVPSGDTLTAEDIDAAPFLGPFGPEAFPTDPEERRVLAQNTADLAAARAAAGQNYPDYASTGGVPVAFAGFPSGGLPGIPAPGAEPAAPFSYPSGGLPGIPAPTPDVSAPEVFKAGLPMARILPGAELSDLDPLTQMTEISGGNPYTGAPFATPLGFPGERPPETAALPESPPDVPLPREAPKFAEFGDIPAAPPNVPLPREAPKFAEFGDAPPLPVYTGPPLPREAPKFAEFGDIPAPPMTRLEPSGQPYAIGGTQTAGALYQRMVESGLVNPSLPGTAAPAAPAAPAALAAPPEAPPALPMPIPAPSTPEAAPTPSPSPSGTAVPGTSAPAQSAPVELASAAGGGGEQFREEIPRGGVERGQPAYTPAPGGLGGALMSAAPPGSIAAAAQQPQQPQQATPQQQQVNALVNNLTQQWYQVVLNQGMDPSDPRVQALVAAQVQAQINGMLQQQQQRAA